MSGADLLSCVQQWVDRFGRDNGVDTSVWAMRAPNDMEFAVCGIPSASLAERLAEMIRSQCAAEVTVLDRHPSMPHWCVMSVATMVGSDDQLPVSDARV